jgi:Icc-related predicted phosphoesterase
MRIALTSDLHVEHHPEVVPLIVERTRALAVDVLVVAGDVSHDLGRLAEALAALKQAAPRLVFVPGNHDLWCSPGTPSSSARYEEAIPALCARAGVDALGHAPVEIGGVAFVGVTGWYDFSLRNRELDGTFTLDDYRRGAWGRLRWNDQSRVTWTDEEGQLLDAQAICDQQVASLERQLSEVGDRPTVAVTHHLPFAELVTSMGELPWDFINGFMGAARLGEAMRRAPNVRLACAGHTHFRKRASIEGSGGRFMAEVSPIGYPREYKRMAGLTLAERVATRVALVDLGVFDSLDLRSRMR